MVLDTNALYTRHINFPSKDKEGRPIRVRRYNMEGVAKAVDDAAESGDLVIPDTVAGEARMGIENAFESAARSAGAVGKPDNEIVEEARAQIDRMHKIFGIRDVGKYRKDIDRMYAEIWRDPRMAGAVDKWRRVKEGRGKGGARPSPETHGADFVILSTAADRAARGEDVRLATFDHDLLAFAGSIRGRFGVEVVDGAGLPR